MLDTEQFPSMSTTIKKAFVPVGFVVALSLLVTFAVFSAPLPAQAAVADWQQGVTIRPVSQTDFSSEEFKASLRELVATGATHVGLVVPYYQSDRFSTDIHANFNTPTDEALVDAIEYAHSLGLSVTLKMHLESFDGWWRAHINPGDRDTWYANYGSRLNHLADIAEANGVEMISIGTEMVSLAAENLNSDNTGRWQEMIRQVRERYSGDLIYGANSTSNGGDAFTNEKQFIGFWQDLDYVGLSVYYEHHNDGSVEALRGSWDFWNTNDLRAFAESVGKPVLFSEIGYRSLEGSHRDPWNWQRSGNTDEQIQANAYEALLSYWNDFDYIDGIYWWEWESAPGGNRFGSTGYTPQGKQAEDILTTWFSGSGVPPVEPPVEEEETATSTDEEETATSTDETPTATSTDETPDPEDPVDEGETGTSTDETPAPPLEEDPDTATSTDDGTDPTDPPHQEEPNEEEPPPQDTDPPSVQNPDDDEEGEEQENPPPQNSNGRDRPDRLIRDILESLRIR